MQSASLFFVPGFILFVLFVWCSGRQSAVPEHLIKITRIINAAKVRNLFNGRIAVPEQFLGIIDLFCQDILDDRRSKFFFKFP